MRQTFLACFCVVAFLWLFLTRSPTVGVRLSGLLAVGHRPDSGPNFNLPVTLDRRFGRSAAFLAPNEHDLSAGRAVFVFEDTQRQHRAFVEAVAAESG